MLKIRLIAATAAILLTLITLPAMLWVYKQFSLWHQQLTPSQIQTFNLSQAVLGFAVAGLSFWWVKRKKKRASSEIAEQDTKNNH